MPCKLTVEVASFLPNVGKPGKMYNYMTSHHEQGLQEAPLVRRSDRRPFLGSWVELHVVDSQLVFSQQSCSGPALGLGGKSHFLASRGRCRVKGKAVPGVKPPQSPSPLWGPHEAPNSVHSGPLSRGYGCSC